MSEFIKREIDARAKEEAEARAMLASAAAEGRDLSAEEDERWNKLVDSADARKVRIGKLERLDQDAAAVAEVRTRLAEAISDPESGAPAGPTKGSTAAVVDAIRATAAAFHSGTADLGQEVRSLEFDLDEAELQRTITDFGNGTALYVSDFATNVAVYARTLSPWLSQGSHIVADNGRPLILPYLSADPTTYTPGEGTAITASDPTLGTATATPVSYKALEYISMEAEEDELVGLLGVLSRSQGRTIGFTAGTAISASIVTAATNGGTATGLSGGGTATFIGYEDALDLKYGAAAPYRSNGSWVMANTAIKKARKWTDKNGQYLWSPAVAQGQPDLFDGQAVYEDPGLAAVASATKSILYGDLSAVVIKEMPLRVATSPDFKFDLDVIAIKAVLRIGGALPDAAAIRYLVSANT